MAEYRPWSDLPPELLSAIATKLGSTPIDKFSFHSVCKSWRTSSSFLLPKLFHPLPLIVPTPPIVFGSSEICKANPCHSTCMLSVTAVHALRLRMPHHSCYCSSFSKPFLLFLHQSTPGKVSFRKPFDQKKYPLPINFPRKIDVLSFHPLELGRFYNLAFPSALLSTFSEGYEITLRPSMVRKVVLFSSANDGGNLFVVALYDEGDLGLLRLLVNDDQKYENMVAVVLTKWEIIHYSKSFSFDDIADFKGRVLGVDRSGQVYNIDLGSSSSSSTMINIIVPATFDGGGRRKRLVESLGRLHLVVRNSARDRTSALFKVYQLCEDTKNWVPVSSLGDQTFFVGLDFSFSASADQLHGSFGKNWILYKQYSFMNCDEMDDDYELFCTVEYDQRIGVWRLDAATRLSVIGSYPDYANVFWPPPTWFYQSAYIDLSECLEALRTELEIFRKRIREVRLAKLSPVHKECISRLKIHSLSIKNLPNRVRLIETLLEKTERIDVPLHQHCNSEILHNQARTSTLETKHQCLSTDLLQRAITQFLDSLRKSVQKVNNSNFGWFWMEWGVKECIRQFEETLAFFETTLLREHTQ